MDAYKRTRGVDIAFWLQAFRAAPFIVDRKAGDVPHIAVAYTAVNPTWLSYATTWHALSKTATAWRCCYLT